MSSEEQQDRYDKYNQIKERLTRWLNAYEARTQQKLQSFVDAEIATTVIREYLSKLQESIDELETELEDDEPAGYQQT